MKHIFTVDVEDWHNAFAPNVFLGHTSFRRLEIGTRILLDLLEQRHVKATFFWLGSCAKQYPSLLKEVQSRGHEIGCHGYGRYAVYDMSRESFFKETAEALSVISDLTGEPVRIFRALNFTLRRDTFWALEMLISLGIEYDSSIFPMWHWSSGIPRYQDDIHKLQTPSGSIIEVPITKRSFAGLDIPATGGGYFRAYPYSLTRSNICHRESLSKPVVFYIHPWELDREHPRLAGLEFSKVLHYIGLQHAPQKLERLLREFSFGPLTEVASRSSLTLADQEIKDMAHLAIGNA
jgi:polysaccharide deacetylase family protein (PEP-CTERM system associated)